MKHKQSLFSRKLEIKQSLFFANAQNKGIVGIFVLVLILVIAVAGGAYYLGRVSTKLQPVKTQQPAQITQTIPSPSPDPTVNWETYINNKRGYSFKYPSSYKIVEREASSDSFESIILEKDVEVAEGEGFGGGDVLKKGADIKFLIIPNKDISETSLQREFGGNIIIKQLLLDNKRAIQVDLDSPKSGPYIFYNYGREVLSIDLMVGFENTNEEHQSYLSGFNQILSTFKFTSQ